MGGEDKFQPLPEETLFKGTDLAGWREPRGEWRVEGGVSLETARPEVFRIAPGLDTLVNGATGKTVDLMTVAEFGDVELHVEFCITKHSNSGVYLQGRYEVQIYAGKKTANAQMVRVLHNGQLIHGWRARAP